MMKLSKIALVCIMLLCAGCGSSETEPEETTKKVTCNYKEYLNIMDVESKVTIKYDGTDVEQVESIENLIFYQSEDMSEEQMTEFIDELVKTYEKQKEELNKNKGVKYEFLMDESSITVHGIINYLETDMELMKKENPDIKKMMKNDKFQIKPMKESYENQGYVCTDIE